jgi:MtfA peptidase
MWFLKRFRRKKIKQQAFPPEWLRIIEGHVPFYRRLNVLDKEELKQHVLVFLAEKDFFGCGGLTINDEIKITIAAQACVLLLHRETDYYPGLNSILVYPGGIRGKSNEASWKRNHRGRLRCALRGIVEQRGSCAFVG